jgi:hypothetical protein
MKSNKKFVILLEIFVITFLVISVVPVCGLSDSSADISAYPSIVNPGDEITVTFFGAPGFELDWIAMYKVGEQDIYEQGEFGGVVYFLEGEKSGTLIFTAPDEPGDYDFRLFEDDGYRCKRGHHKLQKRQQFFLRRISMMVMPLGLAMK